MPSTRLKSLAPQLETGTWNIKISVKKLPPQAATLTIASIDQEGFITGHIAIEGSNYPLDLGVIKDGSVMFRPGDLGILNPNPLWYLFAGKIEGYLTEMKGRVIVPSTIPSIPNKLKGKCEDAGLEGSWTATRPPGDESYRK